MSVCESVCCTCMSMSVCVLYKHECVCECVSMYAVHGSSCESASLGPLQRIGPPGPSLPSDKVLGTRCQRGRESHSLEWTHLLIGHLDGCIPASPRLWGQRSPMGRVGPAPHGSVCSQPVPSSADLWATVLTGLVELDAAEWRTPAKATGAHSPRPGLRRVQLAIHMGLNGVWILLAGHAVDPDGRGSSSSTV